MGLMVRKDFSGGWNPSMDSTNGATNALTRMDNLVLDETGALALRNGSSRISSKMKDAVLSIYTAYISGTRYRMNQGSDSVYSNFVEIDNSFDSTKDVQFTSYLGQIFFANGTRKKKWNGTNLNNWGIAAPTVAPTVSIVSSSAKVFSSCSSAESPGMSSNEGTQTFAADRAGTANAACQIVADSTTNRGTSTKTFSAATDFTDYGSGITGSDNDLIEMYVKVDEPQKLSSVTLLIDVNDGTFQSDYFSYTWNNPLTDPSAFPTFFRPELGVWNYISARRGDFLSTHNTADKWWNTVKAVRVTFEGPGQATCTFDEIQIRGGSAAPITGDDIQYRYQYIRDDGQYIAYSGPSPASATVVFSTQGATVTVTEPTDQQCTAIWLYRFSGTLGDWYRVATKAVTVFTGTTTITDATTDDAALQLDIVLDLNIVLPPNNIVGLSEDYYTRILALTSDGRLCISKQLSPDTFSSAEELKIGGTTETHLWIKKAFGGIYIGTSKDIYRLRGTGTELPDGTLDFDLQPLNINSPPLNAAIAWDGNILVYMAQDGPRLFSGEISSALRGDTDLLWRGYSRYGVSNINTTDPAARMRMAIADGFLWVMVQEGNLTNFTTILYRLRLGDQKWNRFNYSGGLEAGTTSWRTIYHEPDGDLLAGDSIGYVWKLEDSTAIGDNGHVMDVQLYGTYSDDGKPLSRKDPRRLRARFDSGSATFGIGIYPDGSAVASLNPSGAAAGQQVIDWDASSASAFLTAQVKISGLFTTFKLYDYEIEYLDYPQLTWGQVAYQNFGSMDEKVFNGCQLRVCTLGQTRTFNVFVNRAIIGIFTLQTSTDDPQEYTHQFSSPQTGTEFSISADGNIELYEWKPSVQYGLPHATRIWDSGYVDMGSGDGDDVLWLRRIGVKALAAESFTLTPYFNGIASTPITIPAGEIHVVDFGRGVMGRSPRFVLDAGEGKVIRPYWLELHYRISGQEIQKKTIRAT